MKRALLLLAPVALGGCLKAWDSSGPWACSVDDTCPAGFTCDDGVCCRPGDQPLCPTLPAPGGTCAEGDATLYFEDRDGDGAGNGRVSSLRCRQPIASGWVTNGDDCDDNDADTHPDAPERPDGLDNNCNGAIDEGLPGLTLFAPDSDGDGYADPGGVVLAARAPPGMVPAEPVDCQPFDASKHPGAAEVCNGLDDDCDGVSDAARVEAGLPFADTGPGFPCRTGRPGLCADGAFACAKKAGGVERVCQSTREAEPEVCNGVDDDCDGAIDERPACLGPASLISGGDVVWGTGTANPSFLSTDCQRAHATAGGSLSSGGKTWQFSGNDYHLWWAEARTGTWDLSSPDTRLRLKFTASIPSGVSEASGGVWGTPDTGGAASPVVYLCGEHPGEVIRYVAAAGSRIERNATSFDAELTLSNLAQGSSWVMGQGSGFDTSRVKRVEVVLWTRVGGNFTVTFDSAAKFEGARP